MSYRLEFEIIALPKMTNPSGARSTHWRVVKAEKDSWKAMVQATLKRHTMPATPLSKAKLTLTRFSSVSPDPDGLVSGFKTIVDSLVIGGVLQNDKFTNIGMPDYRWEKVKPGAGKVRVIVEAA